MIKVLDHGYCKLVESWGSDERIIEAARMSTNKGFQGWGLDECGDEVKLGGLPNPCKNGKDYCATKHEGDEKLLAYLYNNKHMTPFEMAGMIIEVQAPIFVFREWHRHRTQSFNEMSGRYTELPDLYYIPDEARIQKQSKTNKQGSEESLDFWETQEALQKISDCTRYCREAYEDMLAMGVAREIARIVLPLNQYSRMRASANLRNWLAFLELRLPENAQYEIRQYAKAVSLLIQEKFPRTAQLAKLEPVDWRGNDSSRS